MNPSPLRNFSENSSVLGGGCFPNLSCNLRARRTKSSQGSSGWSTHRPFQQTLIDSEDQWSLKKNGPKNRLPWFRQIIWIQQKTIHDYEDVENKMMINENQFWKVCRWIQSWSQSTLIWSFRCSPAGQRHITAERIFDTFFGRVCREGGPKSSQTI